MLPVCLTYEFNTHMAAKCEHSEYLIDQKTKKLAPYIFVNTYYKLKNLPDWSCNRNIYIVQFAILVLKFLNQF